MSISLEEVGNVARLARLELDERELLEFQGELNLLLGHFQDIQSIDVEGLDPKPHAVSMESVWAEDETEPCLPRDEALRNAPMSKAGLLERLPGNAPRRKPGWRKPTGEAGGIPASTVATSAFALLSAPPFR